MLTYVPYTDYKLDNANLQWAEFVGVMMMEMAALKENINRKRNPSDYDIVLEHNLDSIQHLLLDGQYRHAKEDDKYVYYLSKRHEEDTYKYKIELELTGDREGLIISVRQMPSGRKIVTFMLGDETLFNYGLLDFSQMKDDWEDCK